MKEEDILLTILMVFLTQVVITVATIVVCTGTIQQIVKSQQDQEKRNAIFYGAIHNLQRTCDSLIGWTISGSDVIATCGKAK